MTANLTLWAMSFKGLAHLNCFCQWKGKKWTILAVGKVHCFIKSVKATIMIPFFIDVRVPWGCASSMIPLPPPMRRSTPASVSWADHALLVHVCPANFFAFDSMLPPVHDDTAPPQSHHHHDTTIAPIFHLWRPWTCVLLCEALLKLCVLLRLLLRVYDDPPVVATQHRIQRVHEEASKPRNTLTVLLCASSSLWVVP